MANRPIPPLTNAALWALVAIYAFARLLQLFPAPLLLLVVLHVFPPLLFALLHGALAYRVRGILLFTALSFLTGNVFENLSILTGFPFGHYYFSGVMGPKLFLVPVTLGLAYLGIGYLAFVLGRLLVCGPVAPVSGGRVLAVPLVAAFAMVAWDVAMEPVWSTLLHCWIWRGGGVYFGAPLTNFFGWFLTVYIIYQLFALYLSRQPGTPCLPRTYWRIAVLYYALCAAGNLLVALPAPSAAVVTDPAGVPWHVSAITRACALASLAGMGSFVLLAARKLRSSW
ncbi:MAG TPA: carotenoid biosynthesis protein [Bryobacteraceae bacterium]|nr:carotenoid biosynthesis protein [Bryobacteraceae bacterium]